MSYFSNILYTIGATQWDGNPNLWPKFQSELRVKVEWGVFGVTDWEPEVKILKNKMTDLIWKTCPEKIFYFYY